MSPSARQDPYDRRVFFSRVQALGPGPLVVECAGCGARSRISALDALRRQAPAFLWIPLRRHSRRMRCPACERRNWVRVSFRN